MSAAAPAGTPSTSPSTVPAAPGWRTELRWLAAATATWLVVWLAPLAHNGRRYFFGDTQNAYYGWMYQFGSALRHGQWPILDPTHYPSGNAIAEGQMGLFSPLSALWALGSTVAPNLVVYATLLKFVVALIGIVGGYLLARDYRVEPPLAAVVAVSVALCGFTLMSEAPRWFTGQQVAALLPWAWLTTRRAMAGRHPLPALVAGYLLVSVGYVYGTLFLIVVLAGLLLEALALRRPDGTGWRPFLRGLGVSLWCGLIAVAVYLPGVLTAPVTTRNTSIGGDGPLKLGWEGFLALNQPVLGNPGPDGELTFKYVAWFLPLLLLVDWKAVRAHWRGLLSLFVPVVLMLLWSVGPYNIGPLRWPGRILDAYSLVLVLTTMVLLTRHGRSVTSTRWMLPGLAVWFTAGALVRIAPDPSGALVVVPISVLLAACLLRVAHVGLASSRGPALLLVGSAVVGLVMVLGYPIIRTPQANMPAELSAYRNYLPGSVGTTLVTHDSDDWSNKGDASFYSKRRAEYVLVGSAYNLTDKPVVNSYTTICFAPYCDKFKVRFIGDQYPQRLPTLLGNEPTTGVPWIDLLGIRTLVVGKVPETHQVDMPPGWTRIGQNPFQKTFVRDKPIAPPGSVAWASKGVELSAETHSDLSTSFTVDSVPAGGGTVVLSRLAWPGYRVDGADFDQPLDDILLRVQLTPEDVGHQVEVSFRPPGWPWEVAALVLAALTALGWAVGHLRRPEAW